MGPRRGKAVERFDPDHPNGGIVVAVGFGLGEHNYFGQRGTRPKQVSFGETARADGRLEVRWFGLKLGRRGSATRVRRDEKSALGAEHHGLRASKAWPSEVRCFLEVHFKLAAFLELVKGLVGLDSGGVCSRGARSSSGRAILRLDTVAPSAERRRIGGGKGRPASSIVGRATVRRSAGIRAGVIGVAARSAGVRPRLRRPIPRGRTPRADARSQGARVSAQRTIPDFFAAIVRGVKSTSCPQREAHAGGFAARLAVRRYGG